MVSAGLLCVVLATSGCHGYDGSAGNIKTGYINRRRLVEQRSLSMFLVNRSDGWYLSGQRGGKLKKIVGQGRSDSRGVFRGVTANRKGHIFKNPPADFVEYLLGLPIIYDERRLYYNGTDFLVRPKRTYEWRSIILEGVQNEDNALHVFDQFGNWYRFPNGSELRQYLNTFPKTLAVCHNHLYERSGDGWGVRKRGDFFRLLTHSGEVEINVQCDIGVWFTVRNPPKEFLHFLYTLSKDIYDPYNLTLSEVPTVLPFVPTPRQHVQRPRDVGYQPAQGISVQ